MNKQDLVSAICEQAAVSRKDAETIVNSIFNNVIDSLKSGEDVKIAGFGNFVVKERKSRKSRNPRTNDPMLIPACKVATFRPAKAFKDIIKGEE